MLSKQATQRFRKFQKSSSPYNAGSIQSSRSQKNVNAHESEKKPKNLSKRRSMKRSATVASIPEETPDKKEVVEEDINTRLLKLSKEPGETCSCVCLDAPGKHGDKLCGWEPREFTGVKTPYHCPLLCGEKPAEPEVKTRRKPSTECRLTSAKLGYIPASDFVKHYSFQHCVDDDTSVYIKEYREKYTCKNCFPISTLNYPKAVPFGLDRVKSVNGGDKTPSCYPCATKLRPTASAYLVRSSKDSTGSLTTEDSNKPAAATTSPKKFLFPHEKYIAKYRMLALEEKKARELKCIPSFTYKPPELPKPTGPPEPRVELPFRYKAPKLTNRKKASIPVEPAPANIPPPKYNFGRTFMKPSLVKTSSCSTLSATKKKRENFYSVIPADMSHLSSSSSGKIDVMDNSIFMNQNPIRTNMDRDWKRRVANNRPMY